MSPRTATKSVPKPRVDNNIANDIFDEYDEYDDAFGMEARMAAWPFRFDGTILVKRIAGGVPSDSNVAEAWIKTKIGKDKEALVQELVAKTMIERGISAEEAAKEVNILKHLNGFKRDENGLYIEGRQLKSAIREAVSVAVAVGKIEQRGWGKTNKGIHAFVAEHVMVTNSKLYLGATEPTEIVQRFVSTHHGTGIQLEEVVHNAKIDFTVISDFDFSPEAWQAIWLCGEMQGIGASRSQGFGTYRVAKWAAVGDGKIVKIPAQK